MPSPVTENYPPGGAAAGLTFRELLGLMREDWETHERAVTEAGLHAIVVQRFGAWRFGIQSELGRKAATAIYKVLNVFVKNVYAIELYDTTRLGRRVKIWHRGSMVIDSDATIGDGCLIRQNVTIGLAEGSGKAPRLGRDVHVSTGAVVIGDITVGDSARIGPNALVLVDVPPGATAFASPAKHMKPRTDAAAQADDGASSSD